MFAWCGAREMWLTAARKVFDGIGDECGTGRISSEHLIGLLRNKLPPEEVESAVEAAMIDAGYTGMHALGYSAGQYGLLALQACWSAPAAC